jgi:hypothetical protein
MEYPAGSITVSQNEATNVLSPRNVPPLAMAKNNPEITEDIPMPNFGLAANRMITVAIIKNTGVINQSLLLQQAAKSL